MGQTNSLETIPKSDFHNLIDPSKSVELTINKVKYQVPTDLHPKTSLNYFIRHHAKLKGTKYMCLEGGCGACIVAASVNDQVLSVNSCLVPIFLCDGWDVTTIEGIGGKVEGYNTLQSTLAQMNGSQCGYCSPAMVMNMYCLVAGDKTTKNQIENSFGSNICRCTGYRPILNAFQSFAKDSEGFHDIEDAYEHIKCAKQCDAYDNILKDFESINVNEPRAIHLKLKDANFFKVHSVGEIFTIFNQFPNSSYILNGGNTGNGVYRMSKKDLYIDINDVSDLRSRIVKEDDSLTFGGGVPLEIFKENLYKFSEHSGFEYLKQLADHVDLVAHVSVRNIGTIAGNLMLKHEHREFPSDIFLLLESSGAEIHILTSESKKLKLNLLHFLKLDMNHKLVYSVVLHKLAGYTYKSYKIMPRAQNAHADVNAGFLFKFNDKHTVAQTPNIIFGGINPNFFHASRTEHYLTGKNLLDKTVVSQALKILSSELKPNNVLPDAKPEYRRLLAEALFYKFVLSLQPDLIESRKRSGGSMLERGISSGKEDYDVDKSVWPLNQPITKLEALYQTSGEAEYVNDIPQKDNELFCVLALAESIGTIKSIEYAEALKMDGVVAFYTAKDVPGTNLFTNKDKPQIFVLDDEQLFADKEVSYVGQPFGVLVASSEYEARDAIKKVKLIYVSGPKKKPLLTVQDVLESSEKADRLHLSIKKPALRPRGSSIKHVIKGSYESNSQYHYTIEPHCCLCVPIEDGLDIFVPTQWVDYIHYNVSRCLDIPQNRINIQVRRLGGSYGSKCSRPSIIACAAGLAATKLNKPTRLVMTVEEMMILMGKRNAAYQEYEVGVDDDGKIQYLETEYYSNQGNAHNEVLDILAYESFSGSYDSSTWHFTGRSVRTDLTSATWVRAPATSEGLAMIENIMERIARVVKKDPIDVRLANLSSSDRSTVESMIDEIKKTSDYENRLKAIETFNKENRWKKQGISLMTMRFDFLPLGPYYSMVSVYSRDGTVSISHAGIEMGQGINTKVAQVAAYVLGIDVDLISIKPTNNFVSPNAQVSAASAASDCCCAATKLACEELLDKLKPARTILKKQSWQELVYKAYKIGIDLVVTRQFYPVISGRPLPYSIHGAVVSSVEVDMLTGQHVVQRVDILEDTGVSLNPKVDMGQVQGAFIMGLGLWTSEELKYDERTGALTNYRTWNYKPPGAKDIPIDFRVSFLRNSKNKLGVLSSKATGEPSLLLSYSIPVAIRYALNSARSDAGDSDVWYEMNGPITNEKTLLASLTSRDNMTL